MESKKKILIINQEQFGYHIDTYKYCEILRRDFEIFYLSFDGKPQIVLPQTNIIYISSKNNKIIKHIHFILVVLKIIFNNKYDVIFIKYYYGCLLIPLIFPLIKSKTILDIRTGGVWNNKIKNNIYNVILKFESNFFKNITIISESLADKLKIKKNKVHILPLGGIYYNNGFKKFDELNLLYVGTLFNRNIHQTIEGFEMFYNEFKRNINITYTIIGDSHKYEDVERLKYVIRFHNLNSVIHYLGYINNRELGCFFKKCNIGISYIPMTPYYDCQPSTKTYEYILAGMICLATTTSENKRIINNINGVFCNDNPISFYNALKNIYHNKDYYNSETIMKSSEKYTWENIVKNNLYIYISKL